MNLTLSSILSDHIARRLPTVKLGLIVRGIRDIEPVSIAEAVAQALGRPLAVTVVGYPVRLTTADIELTTTIEDAVALRNLGDAYAQRLLVFVPGDVDKLGSLEMMDVVTSRDVASHLIAWASNNLASNPPQASYWRALAEMVETLPFNMLLDFTTAVQKQNHNVNAIPLNLWRLGLLEDETLLNAHVEVRSRLERNRHLVSAISQLSDRSRRTMTQALHRSAGSDAVRLRESARQLRKFFERGALSSLKNLRYSDVEALLEIGKREPLSPPSQTDTSITYNEDTDSASQSDQRMMRELPLRGYELAETIANRVVTGSDKEGVAVYVDLLKQRLQDERSDQEEPPDSEALEKLTGGRTLQPNVNKQVRSNFSFVSTFCTRKRWGGIVRAEQHTIHDVIQRFTIATPIEPFDPNEARSDGKSLVELLASFDVWVSTETSLATLWWQMAEARYALTAHVDILTLDPIALVYSNDSARSALVGYLDSYSELLNTLHGAAGTLNEKARRAYRAVLRGLLRLDVIFVATPGDDPDDERRRWKAMLTPLHPIHLWRYRTILDRSGSLLSSEEQAQLTKVLPRLPHMLHYVATNDPQLGTITLPQAGSVETLPIYENRTNRYLGTDGIEFLSEILKRWLDIAPYTQAQVRLALIDVPSLPTALREIEVFLRERSKARIVVDVYKTRHQNLREHLAEMDYEGQDSAVADMLLEGRLSLNLYEDYDSLPAVTKQLRSRPVHIAYAFDQSSYDLTKSSRHRHLAVSPLVVTYKYSFDQSYHKGSIEPSSDAESGLFADYHFMVNQAVELQEDESFQVQIGSGNDVGALNQILVDEGARWLAVADRTMLGYAPEEAVPLAEQLMGRRELAVWAHTSSRSVRQFVDLLRKFNLTPDENHVANLMQQYGHIAAGGLFSAARANNLNNQQRDIQFKGLIGTVVAAHWYRTQFPGALIASLDSGLARQWLWLQGSSRERADLIGFRSDTNNNLVIDIIEVKAVERSQREIQVVTDQATGQHVLSGLAVQQLRSTLKKIDPIFAETDGERNLFTHARREALKYQLYRECFRELHPNVDQKRWYELLNSAFRERVDAPVVAVSCEGMVIHVLFEENGEAEFYQDNRAEISLIRLRTLAIQQLVGALVQANAQSISIEPLQFRSSSIVEMNAVTPPLDISEAPNPAEAQVSTVELTPQTMPPPSAASDQLIAVPLTDELILLAKRLDRALATHNIRAHPIEPGQTQVGPSVIRFLVRLRGDEKLRKVQSVAVELQRELQLTYMPYVDNVPGTAYVGIDIPRPTPEVVPLSPLLDAQRLLGSGILPLILGKTPDGQLVTRDLVEFPHLLVAGSTRSGKSVFLRSLLLSLLETKSPSELELLIIDAKRTDFGFFGTVPHLRGGQIVTEAAQAIEMLLELVRVEMRQRQDLLAERGELQVLEFNRHYPAETIPYIVAVIDEYAQLVTTMNKRMREAFERELMSLAAVGRSTGIHLVLATQRPSADIVSSNILANLDCRAVFHVANQRNSQVVLDQGGAENLLGRGDMLFRDASGLILRLQAAYVDERELRTWLQRYSIG